MFNHRHERPDPLAALTDELIMEQIEPGSRVIDLGCGNGRLLEKLRDVRNCRVLGVEIDFEEFTGAMGRGLPMLHVDLDQGLHDIPSQSFDVAVLSQTLQQVHRPLEVLETMFRIAQRALVVVPNFGHWRVRLQVAWKGRAPVTDSLPYRWYETPNLHFMTMLDFRDLGNRGHFRIVREIPVIGDRAVDRAWGANLRASCALYVLERPRPVEVAAAAASP